MSLYSKYIVIGSVRFCLWTWENLSVQDDAKELFLSLINEVKLRFNFELKSPIYKVKICL